MWYGSNIAWGPNKNDMRHLIKYAEFEDGIRWRRDNTIAIDFDGPSEYAICRPCVVKDPDIYRMWFCARGQAYRIYYAKSDDGIAWRRVPDVALDVSESGWDFGNGRIPLHFRSQRRPVYALCRQFVRQNWIWSRHSGAALNRTDRDDESLLAYISPDGSDRQRRRPANS